VTIEHNCHTDCAEYLAFVEENKKYKFYDAGSYDYVNYITTVYAKRKKENNKK
jgi:hypothetical protein